jgi:transposase
MMPSEGNYRSADLPVVQPTKLKLVINLKPAKTLRLDLAAKIPNTGAQWRMLPQCYPKYKTVHRRFQARCRNEVLREVLTNIANELTSPKTLGREWSRAIFAAIIASLGLVATTRLGVMKHQAKTVGLR